MYDSLSLCEHSFTVDLMVTLTVIISCIFSLDSTDGQSEITVDPLPLNLDGVPVLRLVAAYMRSLGASPGFCKYQAKRLLPYTELLVLQFILTSCPG